MITCVFGIVVSILSWQCNNNRHYSGSRGWLLNLRTSVSQNRLAPAMLPTLRDLFLCKFCFLSSLNRCLFNCRHLIGICLFIFPPGYKISKDHFIKLATPTVYASVHYSTIYTWLLATYQQDNKLSSITLATFCPIHLPLLGSNIAILHIISFILLFYIEQLIT